VLEGLFTKYTLGAGEKSLYVPKFGALADAADLTDGLDMTDSQKLTITGTTHTTDEAGCKVIITKNTEPTQGDAYSAAGKVIGNAMRRKIEKDGLACSPVLIRRRCGFYWFSTAYLLAAITQCYGQAEPCPHLSTVSCIPILP